VAQQGVGSEEGFEIANDGAAMQPLKVTIPGEYWDSQIYAGRLYLFKDNGAIETLDWDQCINKFEISPHERLALRCAFQRSDYLYSADFTLLFNDPDVKNLVVTKFADLGRRALVVDKKNSFIDEQDNPFPFPHADSTIYNNQMYVGSSVGLFRGTCDKSTIKPISTKPRKEWDGPSFSIAASYNEIAVAGGHDGLFEIPIQRRSYVDPRATMEIECNKCSWNYYSIFCSGPKLAGIADFKKTKDPYRDYSERHFLNFLDSTDIFGESGFSWARQEKVYLATETAIKVASYTPWDEENKVKIISFGTPIEGSKEAKNGAVASFGTILELSDTLVVIQSDGTIFVVVGDPIGWRIFPKSKHYENQLHVLFEDRMEIYSFNQDYFQDQETKIFGTKYWNRYGRSSWRPTASYSPDEPDMSDQETLVLHPLSDEEIPF
jgi:hypothetical protein